jgi:hypothetical protein
MSASLVSEMESGGPDSRVDLVFPHNHPPKTFKACRHCRQQKSRCSGPESAPCRRCQATGRDCIFDVLGAKKRTPDAEAEVTDERAKKLKLFLACDPGLRGVWLTGPEQISSAGGRSA